MKNLNQILGITLVFQILTLLIFQIGGEEETRVTQFIEQVDQSYVMDTDLRGSDVTLWLKERGIDPKNITSSLDLDTDTFEKLSTGEIPLTDQIRQKIEVGTAFNGITELILEEGQTAEDQEKSSKDEGQKRIHLKKSNGSWVLSSLEDYPADSEQIRAKVQKLLALRFGAPIANRSMNHAKLNVSTSQYNRKLTIKRGDKTNIWYIGSGRGDSSHLRLDGAESVYRAKNLSTWSDLSVDPLNYVNKSYVKVDNPKQIQLKGPKDRLLTLSLNGEEWSVEGVDPVQLDQDAVKRLVNSTRQIRLSGVLGKVDKASYGLNNGVTVSLQRDQEKVVYSIGTEQDGKYVVKAKGNPYFVQALAYTVKSLLDITPKELMTEEARKAVNAAEEAAKKESEAQQTVTQPEFAPLVPKAMPSPTPPTETAIIDPVPTNTSANDRAIQPAPSTPSVAPVVPTSPVPADPTSSDAQ